MYLVSDEAHKPVSTFDNLDDAIACIAGWTQRSARFTELVEIPKSTIFKVVSMGENITLGYIIEGVLHNPSVVRY